MQYIILVLLMLWLVTWVIKKIFPKKPERKEEVTNEYSPQQHEFFEGKKKPASVDFKGKLINMDEHASDALDA